VRDRELRADRQRLRAHGADERRGWETSFSAWLKISRLNVDPPTDLRTTLVESFQAVVWHALVSHPELVVQRGH